MSALPPESDKKILEKKVKMFVGKGGVGKTTISAATAFYLAENNKKTLIISTDPAPSLSDIFEKRIGNQEVAVCENLFAIELGTDEVLRRWKEKFGTEIHQVFSSFANFDQSIVDYVGNAPGIDEEFMLDYVHEIFKNKNYDKIIWDTAPTGHTLRLLKLPIKFIEHLEQANSVYINIFGYIEKIKGAIKGQEDALQIIRKWKKLAEDTIEFMKSGSVTYSAVTIPEALSIYQTKKLVDEFQEFGLTLDEVIINNVVERTDNCTFCEKRKMMQEKYISEIGKKFNNTIIKKIPMLDCEVKGLEKIKEVAMLLFC